MTEKPYLTALLQGKCPKCRQGSIFTYPVKQVARFNKMNECCPHCGVRLEPEPGFYQGAMYVGYAFTIAAMVIISFILYFFLGNPSEWVYVGSVIGFMLLIVPLNYRYSRICYLYWFGGINYSPPAKQS